MQTGYNEEELLLRLLVGLVFPVLVLVTLRMARLGLRSWERRWRPAALSWLMGLLSRAGLARAEKRARKALAFLLGLERLLVFSAAVTFLSLAWFILFPQTRALAQEIVQAIVAPVLGLAGALLKGLLLVLYSLAILAGASAASRRLSRRSGPGRPDSSLTRPQFSVPLKVGIWLAAVFLFLLPYPGMPRSFAIGLLLLSLLLAIIALRPLIEEFAIGAYLHSAMALTPGTSISVEGMEYVIVDLRPLLAILERGDQVHYMPYSRILRGASSMPRKPDDRQD